MRKQTIVVLAALLVLSVLAVGCSSNGGYNYNAPPAQAPTGGGCGVGAPSAVHTDSAEKVSASAVPKSA